MNSLFGVELPTAVNFVIAFVVVLALIAAATWLVRRFGSSAIDAAARGRQPRLAVVDASSVDGRRKLVIIRRDNVEHLLMIGGPTDVVVETNIVRSGAPATREATTVRNGNGETLPRAMPLPDATPWPLQPEPAPGPGAPAAVLRAERPTDPSEGSDWAPSEPSIAAAPPVHATRVPDPLPGLAAELSRSAPEPVVTPRGGQAERARPQPAAGQMPQPAADQNLAEMAQRLEAALRRPMSPGQPAKAEAPAPVSAPAPALAPAPAPEPKPREPRVTISAPKNAPQPKPQYSNIEQEMASLLGRPGKT